MENENSRIQLTIDPEFAEALARVDACPLDQSQLVRELAIRGAQVVEQERAEAIDVLLSVARGDVPYDFDAVAAVVAQRADHLL